MSNCIECGKYSIYYENYTKLCWFCYVKYGKINELYNYKSYKTWIYSGVNICWVMEPICKYCLFDLLDVQYPLCHHCIIPIKNKYNNINIL